MALELTKDTRFTLLDLGNDIVRWSELTPGRLGLLLNAAGETPKAFIGASARFLTIVGHFTEEEIRTTFQKAKSLSPDFTVKHITGKENWHEYLESQEPIAPDEMEVTADTSGADVLKAISEHGG